MDEIDIPSHFLCPISMQLMRDPVTVSTGITYDRESIERWLFSCRSNTCPVTKQALPDTDLTPNHTLRRLIQAWCTLNASHGVERIPTPKPPIDKTQILKLLKDAKRSPQSQQKCLERLRMIAQGGERNKKCLESAGAVEHLASIIKNAALEDGFQFNRMSDEAGARLPDMGVIETSDKELGLSGNFEGANAPGCPPLDEALSILCHLDASETSLKKLVNNNDGEFLDSLTIVLKYGNHKSRAYAIMLMKSIFEVADPGQLISVEPELFNQAIHILKEKISHKATKAALKLLVEVCPWGRNRIRAVEAGSVPVLVELLLETNERRACELVLVVLERLCGCAEGRAELVKHGASLAIVSKKILRVSHVATERAVRILSSICRFSATSRVLQEMLQVGVVSKLCLVLQMDTSMKTKEKAKEILKLHSRVWKNSACIPPHLLSSYPS